MRIGIDYTPAALQGAGIGRYTRGLVDALLPLLGGDDRVVLFVPRGELPFARKEWPVQVQFCRLPLPERYQTILWHRLRLPLPVELWSGQLDLFHAPNFLLPPTRTGKRLLTIHDLAFLVTPQYAYPPLQRFLSRAVPRSLATADHILADSQASKEDTVRLFGIAPERVTVVGAGVEARFRPLSAEQCLEVRQKYQLNWPFVLSLSTLEPRKNFDSLIRAFAAAKRKAGFPHHLVIGGGKGWLYESIFNEVKHQQAESFVHFLGFVSDSDLPALYNLADLFAFPSHYEGFGIPVLEAMACATAVVCSDTSSLPEIAGDAALLVPTDNEPALIAALAHLLTDPDSRHRLALRGPQQAAHFTWDAAARRLLEVYLAILS